MLVKTSDEGEPVGIIQVNASELWNTFSAPLENVAGKKPLYLVWQGEPIEFLQFELR